MEHPVGSIPRRRKRLIASVRSVRNWQQLGKFSVVGGIGFAINLAVYRTLVHHGVEFLVAAFCSWLVAVTSNYTLNRIWTFREHRGHIGIQGMRFFAVSLAALAVNLLLLELIVGEAGTEKVIGQAIAIVLVTPLNFAGNKLWSFRRRKTAKT